MQLKNGKFLYVEISADVDHFVGELICTFLKIENPYLQFL